MDQDDDEAVTKAVVAEMNRRALVDLTVSAAADFYAQYIDASNSFWNEAERRATPSGRTHPSGKSPLYMFGDGERPPRPTELSAASVERTYRHYHDLRNKTGRHTVCSGATCLRIDRVTKEVKCRFEEKLAVRQPN